MKIIRLNSILVLLPVLAAQELPAQSSAFTYQGRLNDGANRANGSYDMTFALFDDGTGANQFGPVLTNTATGVSNGLFTVTLDFGNQFPGADRWLEIGVATNGGAFSTLAPRQQVTSTPYAVRAANAGTAASAGAVNASNILGTLATTQLPSPVVTNGATGLALGGSFSGNGTGLTNLNAGTLATGTMADARLSTNVALLNTNQTFTGSNIFRGVVVSTNANNAFTGTFSGNGAGLTNLNAGTLATGTVADARLSTNVALLNTNQTFTGSNIFKGVVWLTNANNTFSGTLSGNGAGVTALNAANLSNGTLPDARLSTNVALLGVNQTFSGAVQFNNTVSSGAFIGNGAGLTNLDLGENSGGAIHPLSFTLTTQFIGSSAFAVTPADVNGDSKPDLIAAASGSSSLIVLTNNGNGGFVTSTTIAVGPQPQGVVAADVNGDGRMDLISGNNNFSVSVFTNNGGGGFVLGTTFSVNYNAKSVIAADVNGDGKPDLLNADSNGGVIQIFTNNGSGGFVLSINFSSPNIYRVAAADVNGDGRMDLISANGALGVFVFTNNGSGGFVLSSTLSGSSPELIITPDVNGDGKPDIVTASITANTMAVFTNNGSGGFAIASTPVAGGFPQSVAAADFDGDGQLDLVTANGNSTDSILVNVGRGNFALRATLGVSGSPQSVATGDFNGDGRADLVTGCASVLTLFIHLNNGPEFDGMFVGNGASLSNLNASQLVSGTIGDARLSSNVALLNANNQFTGTNGLNDRDLRLRVATDANHALGWYGASKAFAGFQPDGPMLFGYSAGGLGTTITTQKVALSWNSSGRVGIGTLTPARPLQIGSTSSTNDGMLRLSCGNGSDMREWDIGVPYGGTNSSSPFYDFAINDVSGGGTRFLIDWQTGNVGIGTINPTNKLHVLGGATFSSGVSGGNQNVVWVPGSASWSFTSDRDTKERVTSVDAPSILEKVTRLPINEWSYIGYDQRHIGPMAQDFHAQFPLNENDKALNDADLHGVALAAIQGLNQKMEAGSQSAEVRIRNVEAENAELRQRLDKLESLLNEKLNGGAK